MDCQTFTTFLLNVAILHAGGCLETPTLNLRDDAGNIIPSPANLSTFQSVRLICRFPQLRSDGVSYNVALLTRAEYFHDEWREEARCVYPSTGENPSAVAHFNRTLNMDSADTICESDHISAIFPFRIRLSNKPLYVCRVSNTRRKDFSNIFTIHAYRSSSDTPTMKIKDGEGNYQLSSIDILNSGKVDLLCKFPQLYLTKDFYNYSVVLRTRTAGLVWKEEADCIYFAPRNKSVVVRKDRSLNLTASDVFCDNAGTFAMFTFNVHLSNRTEYDCLVKEPQRPKNNDNSIPVTINVHTKPTTPVIQPDRLEGVEGYSMTVRCTSEGYPPPQLHIKVNDVVYGRSSPRNPPTPTVVSVTAEWRLQTVNKFFHNKPVVCEVYNHPYDGVLQTTKTFLVVYGPDYFQVAKTVSYYVNSGKPLILNGKMAGYPPLVYSWSIGNRKIDAENETVTLDSSDYSKYIPNLATFIVNVKGTNPRTGDTAGNTITVSLKVSTTTIATNGVKKPLSSGEIFAVLLVTAIIIFIFTFIAAAVVYRWKLGKQDISLHKHQNGVAQLVSHQNKVEQLASHQNEVTQLANHQNEVAQLVSHQNGVAQLANHQNEVTQLANHQNEVAQLVSQNKNFTWLHEYRQSANQFGENQTVEFPKQKRKRKSIRK